MRLAELIKIFISVIITLALLEIFSRAFLFTVTKNYNSFVYGFKNIEITTYSLKKLEIFVSKKNIKNIKEVISKNNKNQIWVFGSSNTEGKICNENIISWPKNLEDYTNFKIINLAKSNIFSDYSINLLRNKLETKIYPEKIFWSHKLTEIRVASFGPTENREILRKNFET